MLGAVAEPTKHKDDPLQKVDCRWERTWDVIISGEEARKVDLGHFMRLEV